MQSYKLEVHWGAHAIITVEADNLQAAVDKAYNSNLNNFEGYEGREETMDTRKIFIEDGTEITCLAFHDLDQILQRYAYGATNPTPVQFANRGD